MTVPISDTVPLTVHVVIPAHNEAELIGRCLASVRDAAAQFRDRTGVVATVTVVADSCTDATLEIANKYGADALVIHARCVGQARDVGVRHVLAVSEPSDASHVWIAMTDADSTVSRHWLETQLRSAASGSGLWIGSVHPDPSSVSPSALGEWWSRHQPPSQQLDRLPDPLRVHGANLGFTAATFLATGGFPHIAEHEDVEFVRAALDSGCTWTVGGPTVRTSGRTQGRAPGGFAGYIRMLVAELEGA